MSLNRTSIEEILMINPSVSDEELPEVTLDEIKTMKENLPIAEFNKTMAKVATASMTDVVSFMNQLEDLAK